MREFIKYVMRSKSGLAGFIIVSTLILMALLADFIAPYDPYKSNLARAREGPSLEHLLGTDELGRDLFSRIIYGARITLLIALLSTLLAIIVGSSMGLLAGYYGGVVDMVISRITDMMLSIPGILLAIALVALWGASLTNLVIAISFGLIPTYIRLVRSVTLQLSSTEYVLAAKLLGLKTTRILFKHVLPNAAHVIIAQGTIDIGFAILTASGLGFLGLGLDPSIPEWGAMIGSAKSYMLSAPHIIISVGFFIALSVVGFNLLGNTLRDYLDPYLRGVRSE